MKRLEAFISIIRPLNCIITFFTIVAASFICDDNYDFKIVIIAAFAGGLVNAAGNIINDYFDIEIDKINRPQRALPSGIISKTVALKLYIYITFFVILISYYNLDGNAVFIVALTSLMMFLYSYKLKGIPLLGNIVVAFFTGLAFLFGSIVVGNVYCGIIPSVFALLITFIRELVKDIEDINGDVSNNISTFPIKYGVENAVKLISVVSIILIFSTIIPFSLGVYNLYYLIFVSFLVSGILFIVIKELNKDTSQENLRAMSNLLKIAMIMGVISILIGTKL